jgi:hypothetical protein
MIIEKCIYGFPGRGFSDFLNTLSSQKVRGCILAFVLTYLSRDALTP